MKLQRDYRTTARPFDRHSLRRALALICFLIGVAGCLLPIIPGLPFFVLGGRLLGPRDRTLRCAVVFGRRRLRRLRHSRVLWQRRLGRQLTPHWVGFTRLMLGA